MSRAKQITRWVLAFHFILTLIAIQIRHAGPVPLEWSQSPVLMGYLIFTIVMLIAILCHYIYTEYQARPSKCENNLD